MTWSSFHISTQNFGSDKEPKESQRPAVCDLNFLIFLILLQAVIISQSSSLWCITV